MRPPTPVETHGPEVHQVSLRGREKDCVGSHPEVHDGIFASGSESELSNLPGARGPDIGHLVRLGRRQGLGVGRDTDSGVLVQIVGNLPGLSRGKGQEPDLALEISLFLHPGQNQTASVGQPGETVEIPPARGSQGHLLAVVCVHGQQLLVDAAPRAARDGADPHSVGRPRRSEEGERVGILSDGKLPLSTAVRIGHHDIDFSIRGVASHKGELPSVGRERDRSIDVEKQLARRAAQHRHLVEDRVAGPAGFLIHVVQVVSIRGEADAAKGCGHGLGDLYVAARSHLLHPEAIPPLLLHDVGQVLPVGREGAQLDLAVAGQPGHLHGLE